jgi:glycerophosphoryl diester phosphodiesterase
MAGPGSLKPAYAPRGSLGPRPSLRIPGKAILFTVGSLFVAAVAALILFSESLDEETEAAIIAHRGASVHAPENTLAAFQRAVEEGADWIELDVQEDADGVVVVQHDSDFMKQAGRALKTWEATQEDLRQLDVGSWFAPAFADERVPSLRQALELARGKLGVVIELKYYGHDHQLESRVVEIVEATGMQDSVVIMSLKYAGIRKARAIRPDWSYGLLTSVNVGNPLRLELDFLAVNSAAASRSLIRRAHKRGFEIYAWTVNEPVQMSVLLSRGVDGLITDDPGLARRVMELRDGLTPLGRILLWIAGESGLLQSSILPATEADA